MYLYILRCIFRTEEKRFLFVKTLRNCGIYVNIAQNTRCSVDNYCQKVKTNKYSQKGVDNAYLCEYNTGIANDQ